MALAISYLLVSVRYTLMVLLPVNLVGNSFVVVIFLKMKAARQFSDFLLFNLAMADLLFGTVVSICNLAFHFAGTAINDFYCKITGGVVYLGCGVSVFTLAAIAMERHGAVVKPVRARVRLRDLKRHRKIVQIIWIVALVFVSPIVVFLKKIDVSENIVDCGFVQNDGMAEFGRIYDALVVLLLFFVPNCFMYCLYGRLVYKLWCDNQLHRKPRLALMNSRDKLTKVSFAITMVFTVCWAPYYLRTLLALVLGRRMLILSLVVCRIFIVVNSCANPIIYTLQCTRFRRNLKGLLDCRKKGRKISPHKKLNNRLSWFYRKFPVTLLCKRIKKALPESINARQLFFSMLGKVNKVLTFDPRYALRGWFSYLVSVRNEINIT